MKMNRKMKKIILMAVAVLMATMSAEAQRIRTIDKDGQPVPYVSVLTTDARYIGVTDINGVIEDVKGADTISVSHVAYKPKLYKVNGKSGTITLEDADFGLPEIVVKKKPWCMCRPITVSISTTTSMASCTIALALPTMSTTE